MSFWKIVVVVCVLIIVVPAYAISEELTADKKADIEQLLQMTGALSIGKQMGVTVAAQIAEVLKASKPEIPKGVIDSLPEDISSVFDENMDSLKSAIIPIYHKYFSAGEIKEIIQFYSTDLGKKTIKVMPVLVQESMTVGQQWGKTLGPQIDAKIKARCQKAGVEI
ncbi:MAG: DUF2059 domain-containing protein [Desulfobacteraceae bacterium]|nr:DUF2059 domain-containing protein [Desulfobacteraceae bacterium]